MLGTDELEELDVQVEPPADPFPRRPFASLEDQQHEHRQQEQHDGRLDDGRQQRVVEARNE